jgi:hypothetical protein
MLNALRPARPTSKAQYALRAWCLLTAAWYLLVTIVVVATGGVEITPTFVLLVALVFAGPLVFGIGCLAWTTREGWLVRCLGLVWMIAGFLGLAFFSAVIIPFVFFSLPAAWPWGTRRSLAA